MIKFVMIDGSAIKSDDSLDSFREAVSKHYYLESEIKRNPTITTLPLGILTKDLNGVKIFINLHNVLYIEECNK